jgi:hypothetical protein
MNWWMVAGGMMALTCAAGHAIAGLSMFYRPIKSDVRSELHGAVFTGMWHIITINFTLSAIALVALSTRGHGSAVAWLVAAQFTGYAAVYLVISLRLGGAVKLFQWMPFGATAILSALGAITAPQYLS